MTKRENLLTALFPFACILFMVITQRLIVYLVFQGPIPESVITPALHGAQLVLLFFCGCIAITRFQPFRIRLEKKLLVLFGACSILQLIAILAIPATGGRYSDTGFFSYAYLAVLLGGALTLVPQRPIKARHIALLSAGYLANFAIAVLRGTVYRLTFESFPETPTELFLMMYIASFLLIGVTLGLLAYEPTPRSGNAIPVVIVAILFIIAACLYLYRWVNTLFFGAPLFEHRIVGPLFSWITKPEKLYFGYLEMVLFFAGWFGAFLLSMRKKTVQ